MSDRVRWGRGRFVHFAGFHSGYPTLCHLVMWFHADRAMPTEQPVTCRACLRIGSRLGWIPW
jgi:hypothetical protein